MTRSSAIRRWDRARLTVKALRWETTLAVLSRIVNKLLRLRAREKRRGAVRRLIGTGTSEMGLLVALLLSVSLSSSHGRGVLIRCCKLRRVDGETLRVHGRLAGKLGDRLGVKVETSGRGGAVGKPGWRLLRPVGMRSGLKVR